MNVALRLAMACFVIAAPTLLYLGLLRGLEKLRDDALLMRIAESDDAPQRVSALAARNAENRPIREKAPVSEKGPVHADGRASPGTGADTRTNTGAHTGASARTSASGGASTGANASRGARTDANASTSGRPSASERPPESIACGSCGASNMLGARYCGECLDELH